jgi:glutaredoxin
LDAQVLGISVDPTPTLAAWAEDLGGINFPLLSDFWPHGHVARCYGVFRDEDGHSERAIFVIDKRGIIRYIDIHDIDHQPDNDEVLDVLRRIDPLAAARQPQPQEPQETVELPHGGIVMYCTRWCPACRRARAWFAAHELEFTEIDIDKVPGAADQVRRWANGNRTTPIFDIDGTIIINFNEARLLEALGDHLSPQRKFG